MSDKLTAELNFKFNGLLNNIAPLNILDMSFTLLVFQLEIS